MIELIIFGFTLLLSFIATYMLTKTWIPMAKKYGLVGKDLNKYNRPPVSESGGMALVFGLSLSLFLYLFLMVLFGSASHISEIYAVISAFILAGLIGAVDDMIGWKKGIPRRYKPFITSVLALPFMTIALLYPQYNYFQPWGVSLVVFSFIIVPIGIIGTSNAINMMGGYNGLESGISAILLATLGIHAFIIGEEWIAFMAFIGVAALFGFLILNWYPAKVFPGDSLTYSIGIYIGAIVILGNMVFFGVALFALLYLEPVLYFRAKFIDHAGSVISQGIPKKDGTIDMPYKHVYDSCHIAILIQKKLRGYATERGVVVTIYIIQIIVSLSTLFIGWVVI